MFFIFISFARLPLGDATTILASSPVIVMVLSTCFFREWCGVYRVVAATSLLAGVILISKPPFFFDQVELAHVLLEAGLVHRFGEDVRGVVSPEDLVEA